MADEGRGSTASRVLRVGATVGKHYAHRASAEASEAVRHLGTSLVLFALAAVFFGLALISVHVALFAWLALQAFEVWQVAAALAAVDLLGALLFLGAARRFLVSPVLPETRRAIAQLAAVVRE